MALPAGLMAPVTETLQELLTPCLARQLHRNLEQLLALVSVGPYLEGTSLSLADLAVVAQLSLLRFPAGMPEPLAGRGVPGIADNPVLEPLFEWRDRILDELAPH
jgi:glutathione S-transferase